MASLDLWTKEGEVSIGRFFELVSRSIFMFVHMYVRGEKVCDVTAEM